jgi:hypothetical protein
MAKGKKTGGKDWQPGVSPNPSGRVPTPAPLKDARRLNKTEFELVVNKYLWCSLAELELVATDKTIPVMEAWIVAIMARGIKSGDWGGNEWIAQRIMGKVKDQLEVSTPKPFVIHNADGSRTILGAEVEKEEE